MSDIYTIACPHGKPGYMSHGRLSRSDAIKALRDYAKHIAEEAELILSTPDEELDVRIVRGVHVQHLIERL